jgi:membrane-associated phospholipid phosphatase
MTDGIQALLRQLETGDVVLAAALFLVGTALICAALRSAGLVARGSGLDRYRLFSWQIGVLLGLEQAYEFTRGRIPHDSDVALLNAYKLLDLEWRHGFFVESRLERFFLQFHALMNALDLFYIFSHLLVTVGVLVWVWVRGRPHFPFVRNLFMLTTAIALAAFYIFPTAPPRMLSNYGFVDPLQLHHLVSAGGAQASSYTYNPYAAMPSLHVGYALIVSWGLILTERRIVVRAAAALYPLLMAAAVVITGNHWLLDVAGAFVTVAVAGGTLLLLSSFSSLLVSRAWWTRSAFPARTEQV